MEALFNRLKRTWYFSMFQTYMCLTLGAYTQREEHIHEKKKHNYTPVEAKHFPLREREWVRESTREIPLSAKNSIHFQWWIGA